MRLNDRVNIVLKTNRETVIAANVPAHFGYTATGRHDEQVVWFEEQARLLLGPADGLLLDPDVHVIMHHGTAWRVDGEPMQRMRGARTHHWTVPLVRIAGDA